MVFLNIHKVVQGWEADIVHGHCPHRGLTVAHHVGLPMHSVFTTFTMRSTYTCVNELLIRMRYTEYVYVDCVCVCVCVCVCACVWLL